MDNIKLLCSTILEMLERVDEKEWVKSFQFFLSNIQDGNFDSKLARDILSIYKGSNSFNDFILYHNGKIDIVENIKFDKLRSELFEEAIRLL
jgi:hypothetical protein